MPHGVQPLPRPFRQLTAAKLAAKHSARFTLAQAHREDDLTTVSTWMGEERTSRSHVNNFVSKAVLNEQQSEDSRSDNFVSRLQRWWLD